MVVDAKYDRSGNMETFGLFDDSLPDGWGRRIVDRMFMKREGRLPTVTERLILDCVIESCRALKGERE